MTHLKFEYKNALSFVSKLILRRISNQLMNILRRCSVKPEKEMITWDGSICRRILPQL